ncbi:hypothetical protein CCP3SC5AM1_40017 [Gammaproteobacteria bacterium]
MIIEKIKLRKKQTIKKAITNFLNRTRRIFYRREITFKHLFIIENIILLIIIGTILIYEYYILDRNAINLTTQNKLTATSMIINLLMAIF